MRPGAPGERLAERPRVAALLRTYLAHRRTMATAANADSSVKVVPGRHAGPPHRRRAHCRPDRVCVQFRLDQFRAEMGPRPVQAILLKLLHLRQGESTT